jgi:hypothetical protein
MRIAIPDLEKVLVGVIQAQIGDSAFHPLVKKVEFLVVELQSQLLVDELA